MKLDEIGAVAQVKHFLPEGVGMSKEISEYNWEQTSWGHLNNWPESLKAQVYLLLNTKSPQLLVPTNGEGWIYNEALSLLISNQNLGINYKGTSDADLFLFTNTVLVALSNLGNNIHSEFIAESYGTSYTVGVTSALYGHAALIELTLINAENDKLTEQTLERNTFEVYAEAMPQMAFISDRKGNIIYFNQRWYDYIKGVEDTEGWGWKDQNIHHPDDLSRTIEVWQRSLDSGEPYEIEYRLRRYDGEYRWFLGRAMPLYDAQGKIKIWLGTNTDIHQQKMVEERLKDSDARLKMVAMATRDIVWDWDMEKDFVWWNESLYESFGFKHGEGESKYEWWRSRVNEEDIKEIERAISKLTGNHETFWSVKYRFKKADGEVAHVLDRGFVMYNEAQKPIRMVGSIFDMTPVIKFQNDLKESEERFHMIANNISQLVWRTNDKGEVIWFNNRWYEFTGKTFDETQSWHWLSLIHPDYSKKVEAKLKQAIEAGETWEDTFPLLNKDNTYRWFLSRAIPIKDREGGISNWFGTNTDITDLRDVEEELRKTNQYNKALLESSPDIIKAIDTEGRLLSVNQHGLEALKLEDIHELDGKNWLELWSGAYMKSAEEAFLMAKNGNVGHFQGVRELVKDKLQWWDVLVVPIYGEGKQIEMIVSFSRDITKIKELEHQKDEFIGIASHELKTPLTSIKGSIEIIQQFLADEAYDMTEYFLNKANLQIDKITTLINDLLDVSKIQSGKLAYSFAHITCGDIIEDCVEQFAVQSKKHCIDIVGDLKTPIYGDKTRLEQVVSNLLSNAIKYSPGSNSVTVEISHLKEEIKISVTDKGIGIAESKKPFIFDRFFRVEKTSKQFQGLGLGLYICTEIITRHDGKIGVESEEGRGSTFYFTLPIKS